MIGEFQLIEKYFKPLASDPAALGLGDDAALLQPPTGRELVLTVDALIEGVHFLAHDAPGDIAKKLLRVNLSDLAAKGAVPLGYLMTCAFPQSVDEAFIAAFAKGLGEDQSEFAISLLGGDTTNTPGPLSLSLTAIGHVAPGTMLRRNAARAGDLVFVSGTLGDGALGLKVRRGELLDLSLEARTFLDERYRLPRPRLALGQKLAAEGLSRAALDISDGLVADLSHICKASGLAAEIEAAAVPLSPAAAEALAEDPALLIDVLSGGDDYELCFTVAPEKAALLVDLPVTPIGRLLDGKPEVRVLDRDGKVLPIEKGGWTHF